MAAKKRWSPTRSNPANPPLFITASEMLLDLGSLDSARALDRRLKYYACQVNPLFIDEVSYLSDENREADLLYQVK